MPPRRVNVLESESDNVAAIMSSKLKETDLYQPIKGFLERQGYEVKAEVGSCDVMAVRGNDTPLIVEMKTAFTLPLILQGIDRQRIAETVYLAVPLPKKGISNDELSLCKRLGLGLLCVNGDWVEPYLDPQDFVPRRQPKRTTALLKEFHARKGDGNAGGSTRRKLMTAYRQDALLCAMHLAQHGPSRVKDVEGATRVVRTAAIFRSNVYGWFAKVDRGIYAATDEGREALTTYADVVLVLRGA